MADIMLVLAFAILVVLVVTLGFIIRTNWRKQKEEWQEIDRCEQCLRWQECNGVDEICPWRRPDDGKDY